MHAAKLTLIVAGVCAGGLLGLSSSRAEPSSSERLLREMSAQQVALSRELAAVRAELREQDRQVVHVETVRSPAPALPEAPYDEELEADPREASAAQPAVRVLDEAAREAQRLGQRILDQAAADGRWDQARALGFRAQLMQLAEPEHSALARGLMVRINRGEIVPEPELPGLF